MAETTRKTQIFLQKLVQKFELLGHVSDVQNKPVNVAQEDPIIFLLNIAESVEENPDLSIHRRSLELHRILYKNLCFLTYKFQLM